MYPCWPPLLAQFFFLKYVNPATYQILGNLKIVSTGVLLRLCLQRRLSLLQWMALTLLMVGATTSQVRGRVCVGWVGGRVSEERAPKYKVPAYRRAAGSLCSGHLLSRHGMEILRAAGRAGFCLPVPAGA